MLHFFTVYKYHLIFTVYILKSEINDKYYIGCTQNLEERITRHNQGRSKWTAKYRPWDVVYTESFQNKLQALAKERLIKSYKGGEAFKKLIQN